MGAVHLDRMRNLKAGLPPDAGYVIRWVGEGAPTGAYVPSSQQANYAAGTSGTNIGIKGIDAGRVVPVGNSFAPRAWGALPCVYLGVPK